MYIARVVGTVVATAKAPGLEGVKLLLVQAVDAAGNAQSDAAIRVAADGVQAGVGELVCVTGTTEGAGAFGKGRTPVDLVIVAHVDEMYTGAGTEAEARDRASGRPARG